MTPTQKYPVERLSLHMLKDSIARYQSEVTESAMFFAADKRRRLAVSEANEKSYLCGMNNDFGYVAEMEDVWYSAEEQRFMPLVSSIAWKAEMGGYSIFDPGENTNILWEETLEDTEWGTDVPKDLTEYEETPRQNPGARSEIMNIYTPFTAGPYRVELDLDKDIVQELLNNGVGILDAIRWAKDCQAYEKSIGNYVDPLVIGYQPNVEDQAWIVDQNLSRGFCDAEDSWEYHVEYLRDLDRKGPEGVCHLRARHMKRAAIERNDRFIRELGFIAAANPKEIRSRYTWNRDPSKLGLFWRTVNHHNRRNPEPGLRWLTRSHTILLNFAYRRRLGIKVSDAMANSAVHASENIAEQMKKHCDIDDFNLADVESQINGHTKYFEQLGEFFAAKR